MSAVREHRRWYNAGYRFVVMSAQKPQQGQKGEVVGFNHMFAEGTVLSYHMKEFQAKEAAKKATIPVEIKPLLDLLHESQEATL